MAWEPEESVLVAKAALPEASSVTVAREVEASVKVMEPVGVPAEAVICAVNVTDWPGLDGLEEEISDACVYPAGFTKT